MPRAIVGFNKWFKTDMNSCFIKQATRKQIIRLLFFKISKPKQLYF